MEALSPITPYSTDRRAMSASLVSDAAVERGRVNNVSTNQRILRWAPLQ
jgi:hypothetical protein